MAGYSENKCSSSEQISEYSNICPNPITCTHAHMYASNNIQFNIKTCLKFDLSHPRIHSRYNHFSDYSNYKRVVELLLLKSYTKLL